MKFQRKNGIVKPLPRCKGCGDYIESESQLKNLDKDNPICAECDVKRGVSQKELNEDRAKQDKRDKQRERDRVQEIVSRGQEAAPTIDELDTEQRDSFNL